MTMTCCVIMLGYQSITAMANTNHCNESVNLNGIAGELDIYCTTINDEVAAVQIDVVQIGKNTTYTKVQSDVTNQCYANSWIYTTKDGTKCKYHTSYVMATANMVSKYTFFNTFKGAKGNGRCSVCSDSNGMKNHIGYSGTQSTFTEWRDSDL